MILAGIEESESLRDTLRIITPDLQDRPMPDLTTAEGSDSSSRTLRGLICWCSIISPLYAVKETRTKEEDGSLYRNGPSACSAAGLLFSSSIMREKTNRSVARQGLRICSILLSRSNIRLTTIRPRVCVARLTSKRRAHCSVMQRSPSR